MLGQNVLKARILLPTYNNNYNNNLNANQKHLKAFSFQKTRLCIAIVAYYLGTVELISVHQRE